MCIMEYLKILIFLRFKEVTINSNVHNAESFLTVSTSSTRGIHNFEVKRIWNITNSSAVTFHCLTIKEDTFFKGMWTFCCGRDGDNNYSTKVYCCGLVSKSFLQWKICRTKPKFLYPTLLVYFGSLDMTIWPGECHLIPCDFLRGN